MFPRRSVLLVLATLAVTAAVGTAAADWPQFRHDETHTGEADQPGVIEAPFEPWTFDANGPVVSSPAVATVDGTRLAIVGSYPGQGQPGTLYAVDADGNAVWSSQPLDTGGGYISSPTVTDVDGDGDQEVVVATLDDSRLRLFDAASGSQEWSSQVGSGGEDLIASSPVVADLTDHDGREIVLGGSTSDQDGSVLLYDDDGTRIQALELDGPAWSTPLLEDIDGDGDREVVLATGVPQELSQLFPSAKTGGQSLYAFEVGADGLSLKWHVPMGGPTLASPVAEDLDGDGYKEVVVGERSGGLWAVNGTSGTALSEDLVGPLAALSSPVAADVDGDGTTEVAIGNYRGVQSFNLTAPETEGWQREGEIVIPQAGGDDDVDPWVGASLAHGDVDGDGVRDLVGMTVPVDVTPEIVNSDALPGRVFAVNGSALDADGQSVPLSEGALWSVPLPDDGGLGGPILSDLDGDGYSEVLAGEGVPLIGNGSALHLVDAANPTVDGITTDPAEPTDLDDVLFQASVRDEDTEADDLTYEWDLGDGTTSTDAEPTHRYDDDGTYQVTLTVADPDGHDWTASHPLDVRNVPPEVSPSADTTPGDLEVTLEAGAVDHDGTVESLDWELGDGTTASGATVDHAYPTGGDYLANVTATDDDGDATTASLVVDVNRFPDVDGPADVTVDEGETLVLDYTWNDPDGDDLAGVEVANASGATATWNATAITVTWTPSHDVASLDDPSVVRRVDVAATDEGAPAGTDTARVNVTVENVNRAPQVGPPDDAAVGPGEAAEVAGSLADPDGDDLDLSAAGLPPGTTLSQEGDRWVLDVEPRTPSEREEHDVTVSATDGVDTGSTSFTLVFLPNTPPVPTIELGAPIVNVSTKWDPASLALNGSGSTDPDGHPIESYAWSVAGRELLGPEVEVAFQQAGSHDVTLTVTDGPGLSASTTRTVPVDDALTGSLDVTGSGSPVTGVQTVHLQVRRAGGTPLAHHEVNVSLAPASAPVLGQTKVVETDADGLAAVHFDGDGGSDVFLPGEHTVEVTTSAPSKPGAVLDDTETLRMTQDFFVGPTP